MIEPVNSTSDARIANNVMRHEYRILSDIEKAKMQAIKDRGLSMIDMLHQIGDSAPNSERQASRELQLAQTKIEEAVMWAVKHITR